MAISMKTIVNGVMQMVNSNTPVRNSLIDFCVEHMATEEWPAEQVRAHMESVVPGLKHWK